MHLVFEYCDKTVLELLEQSPNGLDVFIIDLLLQFLSNKQLNILFIN